LISSRGSINKTYIDWTSVEKSVASTALNVY